MTAQQEAPRLITGLADALADSYERTGRGYVGKHRLEDIDFGFLAWPTGHVPVGRHESYVGRHRCDCFGTGLVRSPVTGSVRRCACGATPAYLLPASGDLPAGGLEGTAAASFDDAAAGTRDHIEGVVA